jgi:hypothetical protein
MIYYQGSASVALAVCGDPIVSRSLVLLLQGSGYNTRFLSTASLSDPESLEHIRLLLLTPTPALSTESRQVLLTSLRDMEISVLELVVSERRTGKEARGEAERAVLWPCSTEELERSIEAALACQLGEADQYTYSGPANLGT